MEKGMHCFVSGRVQGVFFRASTRGKAKALGLSGWVRNLPDGRVEVKAFGGAAQLAQLQTWLHSGPVGANVTGVEVAPIDFEAHSEFKTT